MTRTAALFETWPQLAGVVPWMRLGDWPSPLDAKVVRGREVLFKREDLSAQGYAGNKIRPLEMVFGAARAAGRKEIWSTGAYGSNHALATVVHARRQGHGQPFGPSAGGHGQPFGPSAGGFLGGAILWPQPWSQTAQDNLMATASVADDVRWARSIVEMPLIGAWIAATRNAWVMPPGAATPLGAMGHAGAAIELGQQLTQRAAGQEARVDAIVLPVGSTCTSAGLLVGTALAQAAGYFRRGLPKIVAVRVTPWPVTAAWRVAHLAAGTAEHLARRFAEAGLVMPRFARTAADFRARLEVIGDELGPGYGQPTVGAWAALAELSHLGLGLDTTYSAKAAAHLLKRLGRRDVGAGTLVFWATKSAVALPAADPARLADLPPRIHQWIR